MKTFRILGASTLALALTACLVPERFTAKVNIQPEGSYSYSYNGTAIHAMAAMQVKKGGGLSAKDEASLKAEAEKLSKASEVKRAAYTGEGRYELQIEGKKNAGEKLHLLDILAVSQDKDGVITIASAEVKQKAAKDLIELGIKINGTLEVSLPKNAEVISHNATSTPQFFGMFGAYSWKIGTIDQRPVMRVRLKS